MTQQEKKPRNPLYAYNGELLPLSSIAKKCGLTLNTLRSRIDRGMTLSEATTTPLATTTQRSRTARKASPWKNDLLFSTQKVAQ